jgi:hypothetical protein
MACSCNSVAYQEGYNSWRHDGAFRNPYTRGFSEWYDWERGYADAQWEKHDRWFCR